jgi:hypothetical protein
MQHKTFKKKKYFTRKRSEFDDKSNSPRHAAGG